MFTTKSISNRVDGVVKTPNQELHKAFSTRVTAGVQSLKTQLLIKLTSVWLT